MPVTRRCSPPRKQRRHPPQPSLPGMVRAPEAHLAKPMATTLVVAQHPNDGSFSSEEFCRKVGNDEGVALGNRNGFRHGTLQGCGERRMPPAFTRRQPERRETVASHLEHTSRCPAPRHRDSRCFALSRLVTCPIRHRSRKRAGPANRSFDGLSEKGLRFRKWGTYNPLLWSARVLERKPLHVAPMSLCRSTLRPLFAVLLVCSVLAWSLLGEDKPPREAGREPFPGLVPAPRSLPGIGRWQLAFRVPHGRIQAVAWSYDGRRIADSDMSYVRIL